MHLIVSWAPADALSIPHTACDITIDAVLCLGEYDTSSISSENSLLDFSAREREVHWKEVCKC